ncbi:hypothetical protein AV530_017765 [Patagioenas fasciata monilis]|uniref:Uncharacterized protein n=1 Tax=Patagioenas fasciata monilis TaxID=372326 RepID=A0A1V4KHG7_PATFA|nr:hypothetical protein AV530_017765 [Patagioenas fasciata monilis]
MLCSSLSNHQSGLSPASVLSSDTSHAHTSVENTTSLQPSTAFSTISTPATSTTSSVVNMASNINTTNSLGLSVTSVSIPAATTRAAPLVSSGKAPPNLPQGVPPLLHNQYIVGPGGLLPAYPVSNLIVPVLNCLILGASGPSSAVAAVYAKAFLLAHVAPGILVPNAEEYAKCIQ